MTALADAILRALLQEPPTAILGLVGHVGFRDLQRLVHFIGCYGDLSKQPRPQKRGGLQELGNSWAITTICAEVFWQWPRGFHQVLEQLRRSTAAHGSGRFTDRLAGFYNELFRSFVGPHFGFVRAAFEQFVIERWTGALGRRNKRLTAAVLQAAEWIPQTKGRRMLGVSPTKFRELVGGGAIGAESRSSVTGRTFVVVRRSDVERLVVDCHAEVHLQSAAKLLGLTRRRMRTLAAAGLCTEAQGSLLPGVRDVDPAAVNAVVVAIERVPPIGQFGSADVTMAHVLRYWAWPDGDVVRLIEDLKDGRMPARGRVSDHVGIASVVFDSGELRRWRARRGGSSAEILPLPVVARRLTLKQEVTYGLVRRGLLAAVPLPGSTKRIAGGVSEASLSHFNAQYVFGSDLARAIGTSPRALAIRLRDVGVLPVSGPQTDGERQNLYERSVALTAALLQISGVTGNVTALARPAKGPAAQ